MKHQVTLLTIWALILAVGAAVATEASYSCDDGTQLIATFSSPAEAPGKVSLKIAGTEQPLELPQVLSADGGRYAAGETEFWIKGDSATFTRDGSSQSCHTK
jgi:membrane-bound inhibitor of C-type lysozyme